MNSIAGIAVNKGKLFIARRKAGGDLGGKWEFPGGKAKKSEHDTDALCREFLEEFNVSIKTGSLLATTEFYHNAIRFKLNAYQVSFNTGNLHLTEHSEWRWASIDEIENLDFADSDKKLLPTLKTQFEAESPINK